MDPGTSESREGRVCSEELTLPKEESGLFPNSWEVASKHSELPSKSTFVIYGGPLKPHLEVYVNKVTQDGGLAR